MTADEGAPPDPTDQRAVRLEKLERLRASGVEPYPHRYERDRTLGDIRDEFGDLEAGAETDVEVAVAGRIVLLRRQGKLIFATLRDRSADLQLFISKSEVGADEHERFGELIDLGDWVGIRGTVMATKRGELSIKVQEFQLLAKALRPLPDKWHGLTDVDTRFRQRYVDLIVNTDARQVFEIRFEAISAIRRHLLDSGFLEVETPVLSTVQGGATARPFITHYNALEIDTYLRIALELHLKRLIVGGLEKVFEIGRVFRNEGLDTRHNPEFTMLEAYEAFADYTDMMRLTEELVVAAAKAAVGSTELEVYDQTIDLSPPWPRVKMTDLIRDELGIELTPSMPLADAQRAADSVGVEYEPTWGSGRISAEVYDRRVESSLVGPLFVIDHPRETSPLAKACDDDPTVVERFELIVGGREVANAYSELNDPIDQLERFEAEAQAKRRGDAEAGDIDRDYVRALEYGMPPAGGLGIGIDRLAMLLSGATSIREVILFPTLRPEADEGSENRVWSPDTDAE